MRNQSPKPKSGHNLELIKILKKKIGGAKFDAFKNILALTSVAFPQYNKLQNYLDSRYVNQN